VDRDEDEANARLIAAAPELAEIVLELVADAEKAASPAARMLNYERAKAALKKAGIL
jgi:hypothetical protein